MISLLSAIEIEIQPKTEDDRARLEDALGRRHLNQPRIDIRRDPESGQLFLLGNSETEVEEAVAKLAGQYGLQVRVGAAQPAYRETLSKAVTVLYTHKKQMGGAGEFAEVKIEFEPLPPVSGFVFENKVTGGSVPNHYIRAVENGLRVRAESGVLAGFPVIDFKACLVDGKYHEVDSSALIFETAARAAFLEVALRGAVKMLEPIMKVEVVTPDDSLGSVIADVHARCGQIHGIEARDEMQAITAMAPMSCLSGFSDVLQAVTRGRGQYTMTYDHHEAVPRPDDDPRFPGAAAMHA